MTEQTKAEAGAKLADSDVLWALHIVGPDDVVPAPSRELAQQAADLFNATFPQSDDPNWPRVSAAVIEWPHGSKEHALASLHFVDNWLTPTTIRGSSAAAESHARALIGASEKEQQV